MKKKNRTFEFTTKSLKKKNEIKQLKVMYIISSYCKYMGLNFDFTEKIDIQIE